MKKLIIILLSLVILFIQIYPASVYQILFSSKELIPTAKNVILFFDKTVHSSSISLISAAKASLKLDIKAISIEKFTKIAKVFNNIIKKEKPDFIVILSDASIFNKLGKKFIIQKSGLKKIPVITDKKEDIGSGAVLVFSKTDSGEIKLVNSKICSSFGISISDKIKNSPKYLVK